MEYKKIENEIDMLLEGNGLNTYERKLLRKTKEKLSKVNHELKITNDKLVRMTSILNTEIKDANDLKFEVIKLRQYFALNIIFLTMLIIGLLMK